MPDPRITRLIPPSGTPSTTTAPVSAADPSNTRIIPRKPPTPPVVTTPPAPGGGWTPASTLNRVATPIQQIQATVAGSGDVLGIPYGRVRLGAKVASILVNLQVFTGTPPLGSLLLRAIWSMGPIDAFESIWINDLAPDPAIKMTHYTGAPGQGVDPWLAAVYAGQGKTYADTLPGVAYSVIAVPPNVQVGFPRITAQIRGLQVRSTQGGARAWSQNPAYIIADFIESTDYGMGRSVDWTSVAALAAACDALVGTPAEKKRQLNIILDTPQPGETWLTQLRDYAGCWIVPEGSQYRLIPDVTGSSVKSFNALTNMVRDSAKFTLRSTLDSPTCIEVTYTDTSTTPWRAATATVYRSGVVAGTVPRRMGRYQRPGIQRYSEAYRYAVERLNYAQLNDLTAVFTTFDDALTLQVGDIISVTHPAGLSNKLMRVGRVEPSGAGRWTVTANEYDPAVYSSVVVSVPTTPDTTVPDPAHPPAPTGLSLVENLYQLSDTTWSSRVYATWVAPANFPLAFIAGYKVDVYKGSVSTANFDSTYFTADPLFTLPPLQEKQAYVVVVTMVSSVGARSPTVQSSITVLGKYLPPQWPPGAVMTGFEIGGRVFLSWPRGQDVDTVRYDVRRGTSANTWDTATKAQYVDTLNLVVEALAAGPYRFFVKAIDTVQNYTATALQCDVIVSSDANAFQQTTFTGQWGTNPVSMTDWQTNDGTLWATTDWADGYEFGATVTDNAVGTFNDALVNAEVARPASGGLLVSGSGYIDVPSIAAYNVLTGAGSLTAEAWVFPTGPYGAAQVVIGKDTLAAGTRWYWFIYLDTTGVPNVNYANINGNFLATSSGGPLPLRKWSHLAITLNPTSVAVWVNGVLSGVVAVTGAQGNPDGHLGIGAHPPFNGQPAFAQFFNGIMRRVRLYGTQLSAAQIMQSSAYGGVGAWLPLAPVGSWRMDDKVEGDITTLTVADQSANANAGTLNSVGFGWKSVAFLRTAVYDFGSQASGVFTMTATTIAHVGSVNFNIYTSPDNITFTKFVGSSVRAQGRYFYGEIASDSNGVISVLKNSVTISVAVAPRTELAPWTSSNTGPATVYLNTLFAKCVNIPDTILSTGAANYTTVYDQIETAPLGIPGGAACCKFTTITQYAARANNFARNADCTVEGWFYYSGGFNPSMLWDLPTTTYAFWDLMVRTDTLFLYMNTGDGQSNPFMSGGANVAIPLNTWIHIAMVSDSVAGKNFLYFNGVLVGTAIAFRSAAAPATVGGSMTIGIDHTGATYTAQMRFYDFRVWSSARTAAQILANYNQRVPAGGGLLTYVKATEKTGTALADSSGNGINWTLNGTPLWRPINGFDGYCLDKTDTKVNGISVLAEFKGT